MKFDQRIIRLLAALGAIALTLPSWATAANLTEGEKPSIFIGALQIQPSVIEMASQQERLLELKRACETLESQFTNALSATRVFQLVERKRKGDIELEQSFAAVAVDPNDMNIAETGKMSGAKLAFLPLIDGFEDRSHVVDYKVIGRANLNRSLFMSAMVQIVDTTTGQLLPDAPSVQLTKEEVLENIRTGQATGSDQALVALAKDMAKKLAQETISLLRPAKILTVTGRQVMINRGSDSGFSEGDEVEIYAVENVNDEDTGETFHNEIPVGTATIVRLDKKKSFAMIGNEDFGIAKGCVVRTIKQVIASPSSSDSDRSGRELSPGSSDKPLKW